MLDSQSVVQSWVKNTILRTSDRTDNTFFCFFQTLLLLTWNFQRNKIYSSPEGDMSSFDKIIPFRKYAPVVRAHTCSR